MSFVDSSILIEALVADQAHHRRCVEILEEATDTAAHCLLETYSQLTGGRLGFRVDPAEAARIIRQRVAGLRITQLDGDQVAASLDTARRRGARGGAIYDHFILEAARLAKAKVVWTLNLSDFRALAPDLDVRSPSAT